MLRVAFIVGIVAVIALCVWAVMVGFGEEVPLEDLRETLPAAREVTYERSYKDGTLYIEGEVATLDACETATAAATLAGTNSVHIALTIPATEGPCLARPGTAAFRVEITAEESVAVEFLVNGIHAAATPL